MVAELESALSKTMGEHRVALDWFNENKGEIITWSAIQEFSNNQSRLVNQAKGIYKPKYSDYALSLRTIQNGPYPDKDVVHRPDGSWALHYFQENQNPDQRDREATNRGLMRCMRDQVPVGTLVKRKPKPGVAYEILGLGLVTNWENGFFTIEGFSNVGAVHDAEQPDATRLRATHGTNSETFDAENDQDLREKTLAQVARRRGQAAFRADLLEAYAGKCCVTGCALTDALEAAHIAPYRGDHSHHVQNGLLLRSDIHTLFDLGLLVITEDYRVKLSNVALEEESYVNLESKQLVLPDDLTHYPSLDALGRHRKWAGV
ncbi:HNH endonuclease [Jannaschia sp. M317]|uniref:HNH endonuclease n=1 Tax=Jannaschia sp. M317 TaxID=2867011 RepID=UPI0021A861D8|nr:HNH endonuclease [Jannaschia sp. M317]UWQ19281.1 HNH endonuclease [Jannaschia sp. M317]